MSTSRPCTIAAARLESSMNVIALMDETTPWETHS
jgi:hypothetical protein